MTRAALVRLRADLAEALQRRESLQYRWARNEHTSSGGSDTTEDLDVELARVDATIAELEERLTHAGGAPAPPARSAVDLSAPPANDAQAPEYAGTREAAVLLGISARTLEGLRARGSGPPHIRIGRRVLYPRAALRNPGK